MSDIVLLLQSVPYAVAAWLVVCGKPDTATGGRALASILIVGLAMRLLLLPGTPISTDIFRYIWDGRVQAAGINPYLYLPSDAALTGLRDSAIYPYINRADYAPTIYPPASQMIFYLVTRISEAPVAMKAAMVALEGVAVWAILQLLAARGLPRSRSPAVRMASAAALGVRPQRAYRYRGDCLAPARPSWRWNGARRSWPAWRSVPASWSSIFPSSPVLHSTSAGTGVFRCVHRDRRRSISALCRRRHARCSVSSAAISPRRASISGSGVFFWQLLGAVFPLSASAFVFYVAAAVTTHGGARPPRRHARSQAGRRSRRRHASRGHVHAPVLTALRLVLRVAGAVPLLLSGRRSALSHLRLQLPLFRALASDAVGGAPDLRPLHSHSHRRVCVRGRRKLETRHADPIAA